MQRVTPCDRGPVPVQMLVDDPWNDDGALCIDDRDFAASRIAIRHFIAYRNDAVVPDQQRSRRRIRSVHRDDVRVDGGYEEAVLVLLEQYSDLYAGVEGTLYEDGQSGRKVLYVQTSGRS